MSWRQNKQSGVMAIDATISLCLTMMLMILIIDIGSVYRAQNYTYHGVLQTAKAFSVYVHKINIRQNTDTELEELIKDFLTFINVISTTKEDTISELWEKDNVLNTQQIVTMMYPVCLAGDDQNANKELKRYGVAKGLEGIDFSGTTVDNAKKDLIIKAKITVDLPLPVFGYKSVELEQSAHARLWVGK